jgi:hypothetical protein
MFRVPFLAGAPPSASQDAGGITVEMEALPVPDHERVGRDIDPEAKAAYDVCMAENAVQAGGDHRGGQIHA